MKRNPLDKEKFLQGNRQRWAVVFLACGLGVLVANLVFTGLDPVPYMQFLLAVSSLFILGASGDSWIKAYSVKSIRETETKEETKRIQSNTKDNSKPDENTISQYRNEYYNDPSYAPTEWVRQDDTPETFR